MSDSAKNGLRVTQSPEIAGRIRIQDLQAAKSAHQPWPMLTAYDALTAGVFEDAGIPVLLVGDSAAMVVQGHDSTLPISVDDLVSMTASVVRGTKHALVVADLPFGSYQESPQQAVATATRFLQVGAHAVKLEGGRAMLPQIEALVGAGIPVMAHIGLTPQAVNALGGYRVQGRGEAADAVLAEAFAVERAGAFACVLEVIPAVLGERITKELSIPTIGIGAGPSTDAQVLVWQDLLGFTRGRKPKFVQPYAQLAEIVTDGVTRWRDDVSTGAYPTLDTSYD